MTETAPDRITLFAPSHGTYVCAEIESDPPRVVANRTAAGPWEHFEVFPGEPPNSYALRAANGQYLRVLEDGLVLADAERVQSWESFYRHVQADGTVAWETAHRTYLRAVDTGELLADATVAGAWECFRVEGWTGGWEASPGPSRLDGRRWTHADGAPYLPHAVHFMEAFSLWCRDEPTCRGQLERIAELCHQHGIIPCVRFLDTLGYFDYWKGREVSPIDFIAQGGYHVSAVANYYGRLTDFLTYIKSLGGLVRWSRGDLQMFGEGSAQQSAVSQHLIQCADVLSRVGVEVIECWESCNEAALNGVEEPSEAQVYLETFQSRHPSVLCALGAPYGTEESAELIAWSAGADYSAVHGYRPAEDCEEEFTKTLRHIFSVRREGYGDQSEHVAICQGEPFGPGDDVSGGRTDNVEMITLAACISHITAQAWTYMSGWGVRHNGPIETQPGFAEVLRATAQLPPTMYGWSVTRGGLADNTFASVTGYFGDEGVSEGPARIDTANGEGRFVTMVYGGAGRKRIRAQHNLDGEIWNPADDSRTAFSVNAGDELELVYDVGRVLLGSYR